LPIYSEIKPIKIWTLSEGYVMELQPSVIRVKHRRGIFKFPQGGYFRHRILPVRKWNSGSGVFLKERIHEKKS
jgi:hypothetical protein